MPESTKPADSTPSFRGPSILASEVSLDQLQREQIAELQSRIADLSAQTELLRELIPSLRHDFEEAAKLESR